MQQPSTTAIGLGIIAGMRAFSAPAGLSHFLRKHPAPSGKLVRFFRSNPAAVTFTLLALAEMGGDKIPGIPDRISPPGLAGRSLSGALTGALLFKAARKKPLTGALLGGAAALAATFASFYLRKMLTEGTDIPDAVCGAAEDAVVIAGIARLATR